MSISSMTSFRYDLLSEMLLELIEILRDRQGSTWDDIVRITSNKSATIAIDNTRIHLEVTNEPEFQIKFSAAKSDASNAFESTGKTLCDIMYGRTSLDKSVASGKICIYASFGDLLKIRSIVASVLAEANAEPRLQSLWEKFDREWLG